MKATLLALILSVVCAFGADFDTVTINHATGNVINSQAVSFASTKLKLNGVTLEAAFQPLDADLTAIAALTTTSFGRASLALADNAAFRSYIGAGTSSFSGAFSALTGTPTTLSGYGITDPIVLTSDTGTVTNTMLAGSIANAKLANSSITIGGASVALGATIGTGMITGLTEDTSPSAANDFVMTYDASATAFKKVKLSNIGATGDVITSADNAFTGANTFIVSGVSTVPMIVQNTNASASADIFRVSGNAGAVFSVNRTDITLGGDITQSGAYTVDGSFDFAGHGADNVGYILWSGSATPNTPSVGYIALDTNALGASSHGAFQFHDGTQSCYLVAFPTAATLTNGSVPTYDSTNHRFNLSVPSGAGDVVAAGNNTFTGTNEFTHSAGAENAATIRVSGDVDAGGLLVDAAVDDYNADIFSVTQSANTRTLFVIRGNGDQTFDAVFDADTVTGIPTPSAAADAVPKTYVDTYFLPDTALDTDGTLAANSDAKIPSQKAVKTYVDANAGGGGSFTSLPTWTYTASSVSSGQMTTDNSSPNSTTSIELSNTTLNGVTGGMSDYFNVLGTRGRSYLVFTSSSGKSQIFGVSGVSGGGSSVTLSVSQIGTDSTAWSGNYAVSVVYDAYNAYNDITLGNALANSSITPVADGTYATPTSITTSNGVITAATGVAPIADGTYAISTSNGGSVTIQGGIITAWTPAP